jgi:hypothetical protein
MTSTYSMNAAVLEAVKELLGGGNWKPTYRDISLAIVHGPDADPTSKITPWMEAVIRNAMRGMAERLHEQGILVVPVSAIFYQPASETAGWGNGGQEPRSIAEAYLCLAKAGKPITGLVQTKPAGFLWKAWRQDGYLKALASWETEQRKIARDVGHRWLTAGEYDSLTRDGFRQLLN